MTKFKISQIQFQAKATPQENAELLEVYFMQSQKYKPDLICTPECSNIITGDKEHLFRFVTFQNDCPVIKKAKLFARDHKVNINLVSLLLRVKGKKKLVNRSLLINKKGKIQSLYDKINLFDASINKKENYRESDSFIKGSELIISKINGVSIGHTICYDLRFPNLYRKLAKKGAQIILIPAAFTVHTGKAHWETLVRARAIENSIFIVATSMCGTHHAKRKTYGHSLLFDPWGKAQNQSTKEPTIINTSIDLSKILKVRSIISSIHND